MNERIKALLEQSSEVYDYWYKGDSQRLVDHKMFAELIVRECAQTVQDFVDHRIPASEYPARLKKHFGVEE